jgi:hypothetical protein
VRTSARATGAAVTIAAALLMTGCGSGGDGPSDKGGAEQSSGEGGASTLKGAWISGDLADQDNKIMAFVETGNAVNISTASANCTGTYTPDADPVTVRMVCSKGSGFEQGTVESVDTKSMTIAWEGGGSDTFSRAENALDGLPTGMPTELPTDLPGDLPTELPGDLPTGLPE